MNRHVLAIAAIVAGFAAGDAQGAERQPHLGLPVALADLASSQPPELVALGRRLFFEAGLSANGRVSCASCHQTERAFTDGRPIALGIHEREGTRNTPTVINAALHITQFWDGRRGSLEEQAADPFVNPAEHGLPDHDAVLAFLRQDDGYRRAFLAAFGVSGEMLAMQHVTGALASFVRSLASGDSAFDRYLYGGDASALALPAKRGLELFRGRAQCAVCHTIGKGEATLTDNQFHSIGVGLERIAPKLGTLARRVARASKEDIDKLVIGDREIAALGRYVVTRHPADIAKFKTPTLRNVALTAPYMHDGSIATLEDAIDHELYYRGQSLGRPLILTPVEKQDLLAFLASLTSSRLPR